MIRFLEFTDDNGHNVSINIEAIDAVHTVSLNMAQSLILLRSGKTYQVRALKEEVMNHIQKRLVSEVLESE